jgi:Ca2+-binding EF-hand superfamily protein
VRRHVAIRGLSNLFCKKVALARRKGLVAPFDYHDPDKTVGRNPPDGDTRMKKITLLSALIVTGFAMTPIAQARGMDGQERPSFEMLDADADGQLTRQEMQDYGAAMAASRFAQTDANADGELSVEELTDAAQQHQSERANRRASRMIERLDADGNGTISSDEVAAMGMERGETRHNKMFERLDENEDGAINAEEFEQARAHSKHSGDKEHRKGHGKDRN